MTVDDILMAASQTELYQLVEDYLIEQGEDTNAQGESFAETAQRLGGDSILEAAERRWYELG